MIFFDLDGTLLDSNRAWEDIDRTFLGRHGLAIPEGYVDYSPTTLFPTPPTTHAPTIFPT